MRRVAEAAIEALAHGRHRRISKRRTAGVPRRRAGRSSALGRLGGGALDPCLRSRPRSISSPAIIWPESDGAAPLGATPLFQSRSRQRVSAAALSVADRVRARSIQVDTRLRPLRRGQACSPSRSTASRRTSASEPGPGSTPALTRARPVFGSAGAARDAAWPRSTECCRRRRDPCQPRRRRREDARRHRPPQAGRPGRFDVKLIDGGLVDLEFRRAMSSTPPRRYPRLDPGSWCPALVSPKRGHLLGRRWPRHHALPRAHAGYAASRSRRTPSKPSRHPHAARRAPAAWPTGQILLAAYAEQRQTVSAELAAHAAGRERKTCHAETKGMPHRTVTLEHAGRRHAHPDRGAIGGRYAGPLFLSQGRHDRAAPTRRWNSPALKPAFAKIAVHRRARRLQGQRQRSRQVHRQA